VRIIGSAEEFWRLRVTRVDTTDDLDFEWHEDILYREPAVQPSAELELWHVEAVSLGDVERVVRVATFTDRADAERFFDRAHGDLGQMTRSQFEEVYLAPDDTSMGELHPGDEQL